MLVADRCRLAIRHADWPDNAKPSLMSEVASKGLSPQLIEKRRQQWTDCYPYQY